MRKLFLALVAALAVVCALVAVAGHLQTTPVSAQEPWVVRSFDATYAIQPDSSVQVTEDILVDFQGLEKHGIYRYIPVEYTYEPPQPLDATYHRVISIDVNQRRRRLWYPIPYSSSRDGANLVLKIGDPNHTISGQQRYRIVYTVTGAMNAFDDHDEFFWNVTGNDWPVNILSASATVTAPAIKDIVCFQGLSGSQTPCTSQMTGNATAQFESGQLTLGAGLTFDVATPPGAVTVPPPMLVRQKTAWETIRDFMGFTLLPIVGAILLGIAGIAAVVRLWWLNGRDRWFGDVHYLTGDNRSRRKPLFSRDTVVVEYTPPEIGNDKRRLRPAEIGLLLDERADTLDVSATIIDLAVRGYLRIKEEPKTWMFGKSDYELTRLKEADDELLPYEATLLTALFEDGATVSMSSLRNKFYEDLSKVKTALYTQGVKADKFFPGSPEKTRARYLAGGFLVFGIGVVAVFALGTLGVGVFGIPIALSGLILAAMSSAMARRSAVGREYYRRALGFREFMVTAETDHQRFNEEENIFDKYLPYAIVYDCVDKWAKAFEGLEQETADRGWYVGAYAFAPIAFASNLNSFSSSLSGAIASTPASSGSSGFGGGGFSGGGFGGGGGGSW